LMIWKDFWRIPFQGHQGRLLVSHMKLGRLPTLANLEHAWRSFIASGAFSLFVGLPKSATRCRQTTFG
jgi:hypothetical protein